MPGTRPGFVAPYRARNETTTRFIPATVYDNQFLNREYVSQLEALTGWMRRAWLDGDWDIAAGQYFTTWRNDVHVIEPFAIPKGWRVWASLDYGFTHYTVCHLLARDGEGRIYIVDEHAARGWVVERHVEAIRAMLARWGLEIGDLRTFVAGADVFAKKDQGPTIADRYKRAGIRLRKANDDRVNGAAEILARLGDVEAGIEPTLFVFNTCRMLIEQIPALEHDPHRPEDVLKVDVDEHGIGGDDAYDSARYGIMAEWRPRLQRGRVDFYAAAPATPAPVAPVRTDEEIERLLAAAEDAE